MKTKSMFPSLILAALGLAAFREPGYSNVIGYVVVPLTAGYNLIENPLNVGPDNNITNVIASPPQDTAIYLWDVPSQTFGPVATFDSFFGWDTIVYLPPGRGFFWYAPSPGYTNVFVGEVLQGSQTNFVAGNNKLSALGSKVPQSGALSTDLAFPAIDGANVFFFNGASQTFTDAFTCFNGFGWFDPNGVAGTGGPVLNVGQAFFVQNPGPDANWVRNFTVQFASLSPNTGAAKSEAQTVSARISSVQISGASVTVKVQNPSGSAYTLQFSSDGLSWATVASGLTGSAWQGKFPGGSRGYYQVAQP
jgi:hypothetical protein